MSRASSYGRSPTRLYDEFINWPGVESRQTKSLQANFCCIYTIYSGLSTFSAALLLPVSRLMGGYPGPWQPAQTEKALKPFAPVGG
jgi:hypothetical protein